MFHKLRILSLVDLYFDQTQMVLKAVFEARLCSVHIPMAQLPGTSRHFPSLALVSIPREL